MNKLPSAIVLLSIASGTQKTVLKHLRLTEGISEAYVVHNAYDVIVKLKAGTFEKLSIVLSAKGVLAESPW